MDKKESGNVELKLVENNINEMKISNDNSIIMSDTVNYEEDFKKDIKNQLNKLKGSTHPKLSNEEKQLKQFDTFSRRIKEKSVIDQLILIEYTSIAVSFLCLIVNSLMSYDESSMSALAVATDSFLDVLAYVIVLIRFLKKNKVVKDINMGDETEKQEKHEDSKVLMFLSILFISSSTFVAILSIKKIISKTKPTPNVEFIWISLAQSIIFSVIAIFKFKLSLQVKLNSTIYSDAFNSLIAAISTYSMAISMSAFIFNESVWYLDSVCGVVIAFFVFAYGCQLFFKNFSVFF
jgi:hypothetical protein